MVFNYLIFLCIGTYVSCMPIEELRISLKEAIICTNHFLTKMKNDVPEPLVDIPETVEDGCIKNNLKIIAGSLGKMRKYTHSEAISYRSCDTIFSDLSKKWPGPVKTGQNCTTIQGRPKLLLQNVLELLREWKNAA